MTTDDRPDVCARVPLPAEIDGRQAVAALWQGPGDPQMRFEGDAVLRATRTPEGPASLRIRLLEGKAVVEAWGPGARAAVSRVAGLIGAEDEVPSLDGHPVVRRLARRLPGMRLTRSQQVYETLVASIVAQKVTGFEARRSWRGLLYRFGEAAPGPLGLRLPPAPAELARQPYHAFHVLGLERRRAEALRSVASVAAQLEAAASLPREAARRRLLAVPGVGSWTAAETMRLALGDPDAVSVGDYNLPKLVCWALAGEPRGDDVRMLELLEPYRGQRARVVRLLELGGAWPPRRGPRLAPRSIASI